MSLSARPSRRFAPPDLRRLNKASVGRQDERNGVRLETPHVGSGDWGGICQ